MPGTELATILVIFCYNGAPFINQVTSLLRDNYIKRIHDSSC